jgi:hypothetical protein
VPLGNAKFDAFSRLSNHRGNLALLLRDVFEMSSRYLSASMASARSRPLAPACPASSERLRARLVVSPCCTPAAIAARGFEDDRRAYHPWHRQQRAPVIAIEPMNHHGYPVSVGDQVFLDGDDEEIGAVRQVTPDQVVIYLENAGDFIVRGPQVKSAHDGKLVLDPQRVEPALLAAARAAHERETE